jgi:hypothetical protein
VGIYFVQEMQEHFKEQYRYSGVSVVISRILEQRNGEYTLELVGTYNYYNSVLDNYFTLPIRKARKGKYLFRVYIWWPERSNRKQPLVAGVYSSAKFGVKDVTA